VRILADPVDAIDRFRQAYDEEDPETGVAPAAEIVTDAEALPKDGPESYSLPAWENKQRMWGRMPCEAMYYALSQALGPQWWEEENEVIFETIHRAGFRLGPQGFTRTMALKALMSAPQGESLFHRNWKVFLFLATALSGRPGKWGDVDLPTPLEVYLAMKVAAEFRPEAYSDEVLSAIAASCLEDGLWVYPGVMGMAQAHALGQLRYYDIPVTVDDVEKVQVLVAKHLSGDDQLPDEPEGYLTAQALLVLDLVRSIEFLDEAGDSAVQDVHDVISGMSDG
jgi:hypothetical protein